MVIFQCPAIRFSDTITIQILDYQQIKKPNQPITNFQLPLTIMKQYVIIARDGLDEAALDRRMAARPVHFEGMKQLKANHQFVLGGAMLNEAGTMAGSVLIVQFETEEAFQNWYENEPYITQNVWQSIEIKPFKVADV